MVSQNQKRSLIVLVILIGVFLASIFIEEPDLPFGICLFKGITGIPCPSCGMTHSFVSLGDLKIRDGFSYNIMGPLLYSLMLIWIVINLFEIYFDRLIIHPFFKRYERYILLLVVILSVISWGYNLLRSFKIGE